MIYREVDLRGDGTSMLKVMALNPGISHGRQKKRPAIVVCPGGGYLIRADKEQEPVAARFLGLGYQLFILSYPVFFNGRPSDWTDGPEFCEGSKYPEQLCDLMRAMAYVHACADELDIDTDRIYALGFSAGAHLVGSLAERWDDESLLGGIAPEVARPRAVLMGYPMIDAQNASREEYLHSKNPFVRYFTRGIFGTDEPTDEQLRQVDLTANARADMPRVFIWHTVTDDEAPAAKSAAFVARLMQLGVPCDYHLFQDGRHGNALADSSSAAREEEIDVREARWVELAASWLDMDVNKNGWELSHE